MCSHCVLCALCREDANRAIEKLDGYGYDNLILRVEYAAPREDRPPGERGGGR